jgi:hypothetical protein
VWIAHEADGVRRERCGHEQAEDGDEAGTKGGLHLEASG